MLSLFVHIASVLGTVLIFVGTLWVNEHVFSHSEFARGINWIYLPAGIRLLSTLLLAEDGAIGLLLAGWLVKFFYFFPDDALRAGLSGIISALAPYLIYKAAQYRYGLDASLSNLTTRRLFVLIVAFSILDPLAQHILNIMLGQTHRLFAGFAVMVVGNLVGTMLVVYSLKAGLALVAKCTARSPTRAKSQSRIRS